MHVYSLRFAFLTISPCFCVDPYRARFTLPLLAEAKADNQKDRSYAKSAGLVLNETGFELSENGLGCVRIRENRITLWIGLGDSDRDV